MKKMSITEFSLCRLCMSTEQLQDLLKIHSETMLDKIYICVDVKVQLGDGLPSQICTSCIDYINKFYNFKQLCVEVDSKFKQKQNKMKLEIEPLCFNEEYKYDDNEIQNGENEGIVNVPLTTKRHQEPNNSRKQYQCEKCGQIFKIKGVLDKHLLLHSGIKPFACNICPKTFARAENKRIHMRSHLGIRPYICEVCGSASTKRQDLIRHLKIHSDEKKYKCPHCSRRFKRSGDLKSHIRTHSGSRPYSCQSCEKTYTSHGGLRKHRINCKRISK